MLLPTCLILGMGTIIGQNLPEIRDTIRSRNRRAYGGTAMYLATASLSRGVKLWMAALAVRGLLRAGADRSGRLT